MCNLAGNNVLCRQLCRSNPGIEGESLEGESLEGESLEGESVEAAKSVVIEF